MQAFASVITDLPSIVSIAIDGVFHNFNCFLKLPIEEMIFKSQNLGIFETYMMFRLVCMLSQSKGTRANFFDIDVMLLESSFEGMTSFTNVGFTTGVGDQIYAFSIRGFNGIFHRSKRVPDGHKVLETSKNVFSPQDSC